MIFTQQMQYNSINRMYVFPIFWGVTPPFVAVTHNRVPSLSKSSLHAQLKVIRLRGDLLRLYGRRTNTGGEPW